MTSPEHPVMEETHTPDEDALRAAWSRRRFLRGSAVGAVGVAAATIAACAPAPPGAWLYRSPTPNNPGAWAFHCHILPHAEGPKGMFGMVNALIVQA